MRRWYAILCKPAKIILYVPQKATGLEFTTWCQQITLSFPFLMIRSHAINPIVLYLKVRTLLDVSGLSGQSNTFQFDIRDPSVPVQK